MRSLTLRGSHLHQRLYVLQNGVLHKIRKCGEPLMYGTLTRLPVGENQAALIVDAHKGLMGTAALRVSTLSDLYGRMKAMSEPAIFELDSLILRRMVPGRCNLCN